MQDIKVYAHNSFTHDSVAFQFKIIVIEDADPKTQVIAFLPDLTV